MAQSPLEMQLAGAGGAEVTLSSGQPDVGVDTASDTLKLCGLGEEFSKFVSISPQPPLSCQARFFHSGNGYSLSCSRSRESPKDTTSVAAPSSLQMF